MKFEFSYMEWQEDEGFEIEMIPAIGCLEKQTLDQAEDFEVFMQGYYDYMLFIRTQSSELSHIELLEKQLKEAKKNDEQEVVFYVEEYSEDEKDAWKFFINKDETKFFKPHRNIENNEHFQNTAIPTELFLALLEEWKKYIESGSQEEKIVDIPFEYDEAVYRTTGKIQRKEQQA